MATPNRRALHFVFKVGNRTKTAEFYRDVLGMNFLRHEEFEKGCEATCNGPYDGKWSKSMVGYGPEDLHFVIELTYNYGIGSYKLGNDFRGITIHSKDIIKNANKLNYPVVKDGDLHILTSPDGYKFIIREKESDGDPVKKVTLSSSDLEKSVDYWTRLLGMKIYSQDEKTAVLGYGDKQCKLELYDIGTEVDHGSAFGRIAFACPSTDLPDIQSQMKEENQTILTELITLSTPGKADVQVVILADPDKHEICFVGDEGFRALSQLDAKADHRLDMAIEADKSDEWFQKKGKTKATG